MARRGLRPIEDTTRAAASITANRLGERLPVPPVNDEIGRHFRVLNDMFDRLQRSFEQATRFSADASHESDWTEFSFNLPAIVMDKRN
jgi:methyl-accepting chemotaxis protein